MRLAVFVLVCAACASVAAAAAWVPPVRDGTWLQSGIQQQARWSARETLSDEQLSQATMVTSYVCGVVDLEKYLVQRAVLLSGAVSGGKKKPRLDPKLLAGMARAAPLIVPLMETDFAAEVPSCDRALGIVRDYLEKYPEMLDKDADVIVEKALLEAYKRAR
jgi:hypothetical protein